MLYTRGCYQLGCTQTDIYDVMVKNEWSNRTTSVQKRQAYRVTIQRVNQRVMMQIDTTEYHVKSRKTLRMIRDCVRPHKTAYGDHQQ
jgi:hypothetical protein